MSPPYYEKSLCPSSPFKDRFFAGIKQASYHEINWAIFNSEYVGQVKPSEEGAPISDDNFRRMVYLFFVHDNLSKLIVQC